MRESRLEAAHTPAKSHTLKASRGVTRSVVQKTQKHQVCTEVYHTSITQMGVRKELSYCVKASLDHVASSKYARMYRIVVPLSPGDKGR